MSERSGAAVVSFTRVTMGKLMVRTMNPDQLAAMAAEMTESTPPVSHWTLRVPGGALMVDVHSDREALCKHVDRYETMFSDPLHRLDFETYEFLDSAAEVAALNMLGRASAALQEHTMSPMPAGGLQGRLVSMNRWPHLPPELAQLVRSIIEEGQLSSVSNFLLEAADGSLLLSTYLQEGNLIDDFVVIHDLLADAGYSVKNEWYPFTDRVHEQALDWFAFGLGAIAEVPN